MKKLLPILSIFILGSSFLNAETITKKPVTIDITTSGTLSEEEKAQVEALKVQLESKLYAWEKFEVEAPSSVFRDVEYVKLSDLIVVPDNSEVVELGGARLTDEQITRIKEEGLFVVPSKKYPGQNHIWKLSAWFQHGTKTLNLKFSSLQEKAATQLLVKIPQANIGSSRSDGPTSYKGLRNIGVGVAGIWDLLIGNTHNQKTYHHSEVAAIIQEAFVAANPSANILDLPQNVERYAPIVERISQEVSNEWETRIQEQKKAEFVSLAQKNGLYDQDQGVAEVFISAMLSQALVELYETRLKESVDLRAISPDLAAALSKRLTTNQIIENFESILQGELEQIKSQIANEVSQEKPYLSKVSSWFDTEVNRRFKLVYAKRKWTQYDPLVEVLNQAKLESEAQRVAAILKYLKDKKTEHDENLRNSESPSRTFRIKQQIWLPKNWKISQKKDGSYSYNDEKLTEVTTDVPGWRLWLMAARTKKYFTDGLYSLAYLNIVNGPMGVRSLFSRNPFYARKTVNENDGEIVDDERSLTQSMASRWTAINTQIDKDVERAMAKSGRSILGEKAYRALTNLRFKVIKQGFLKLMLGVGQPVLTACNLAVSGALCVATPVWSPVLSVAQWAFNAVLADTDKATRSSDIKFHSPRFLPMATHLLANVGVFGFGQYVISYFRMLGHGLAALGIEAGAAAQWAALKTKDLVIRGALLNRSILKTPSDDTWLARRIQGPGLENEYYYQIKADLALVVMQLHLEGIELDIYQQETKYKAEAPERDTARAFSNLFGPFTDLGRLSDSRGFHQEILKSVESAKKALEESTPEAREFLNSVSGVNEATLSKVRMSEADLNELSPKAIALVEKFYTQKLQPKFEANKVREAAFWNNLGIDMHDYLALSKIVLTQSFGGEGILNSLESVSGNFKIIVDDEPKLGSVVDAVMDGATIPTLDTKTPRIVDTTKSKTNARIKAAPSVRLDLAALSTRSCELSILPAFEARN